jgi:carbon monoxide dehydrogenase subunit G
MEFKGRYLIPAPAEKVWAALNNPDVLRQCIPGCDRMEKTDPTHFSASATLKIGPVKANFRANIALEDLDPPRHCRLKGEGQGGVAGFARGEAEVDLTPGEGGTTLSYAAQANIGGKLAQIGQRLIDGAAKQIADDFFVRFREAIAALPESEPVAAIVAAAPARTPTPTPLPAEIVPPLPDEPRTGLAPEVWVVGLIAIIASLLMVFGAVFPH